MGFENGDVFEVRVMTQDTAGHTMVNALHYDAIDAITGETNSGQALADFFRDHVTSHLTIFLNANWSVMPYVVTQVLDPQDKLAARTQWVSGVATPGVRGSASDPLPLQNCSFATLRTGHIGKRFRGRCFLPWPLLESDQQGGIIEADHKTAAQAYMDAIPRQPDVSGPLSPATCTWSVYSRTQRAQNRNPYLSAVTSAAMQNEVHVLRSRQIF